MAIGAFVAVKVGGMVGLDTRHYARRGICVTCKKGGGGGQKRRAKRGGNRPARDIRKDERKDLIRDDLVEQFEDDVKEPLSVGRSRKKEGGKGRQGAGKLLVSKLLGELDISSVSRRKLLDVLVRGAWIGIGVLAGVFVLVHFVIARDVWPK